MLGDDPPPALAGLLAARAAGSPLVVTALLGELLASGGLFRSGGTWALGPGALDAVPAVVRDLVLGRLQRLTTEQRMLLELVAVAGDAATPPVLADVLGAHEERVLARLRGLRDLGLVAEVTEGWRAWEAGAAEGGGSLVHGEVVYRSAHPAYAEVAYAELPEATRRRLHAGVAVALERRWPHDVELLAPHYQGAGSQVDPRRALDVLAAAGEHALAVHAGDEAARALEAALSHAATLGRDDRTAALLERLGEAREAAGHAEATCWELFGWDDAQTCALLSGLSAKSTEPSHRLADLAELARARPAVRRLLEHQRELVARRKSEQAWVLAHPGPASYGKDPGPPPSFEALPTEARLAMNGLLWTVDRIFGPQPSANLPGQGAPLRGIAASAGRYTGPARVIRGEAEFARIQAGDVLVCPITSPVWSVLFPSIGALVTDTGGLAAAERLGVLERLDRGPADAAALVADCGLAARGATLLRLAGGLTEALRTGVPAIAADTPAGAERLYPDTVPLIGSLMAPAAAKAAAHLLATGVRAPEVLDVGAGTAPWSLALARRAPGCHVTALDLPAVLPATRAAVDAAGCSDRFTSEAGTSSGPTCPRSPTTSCSSATSATSSTSPATAACSAGSHTPSVRAGRSPSSTCWRTCQPRTAARSPCTRWGCSSAPAAGGSTPSPPTSSGSWRPA